MLKKANIIDKFIEYVAPVKAMKRQYARTYMAVAGGYEGADRTRRGLAGTKINIGDADANILKDIKTLRGHSSDLIRNNPLAVGAINTNCTNVVGTGISLHSRIDRDVLGMGEEEADAWESNVEREWRLFSETTECDISRTLNFSGIVKIALRSVLEKGDTFVNMPFIARSGLSPYELRLQLIEAERVCNKNNINDTPELIAGVEKTKDGAPKAYHVLNMHPGSYRLIQKQQEWQRIPVYGSNSGRKNILHIFDPLRPGQTRGIPYLSPVIESLYQLGRYTHSELMAAVLSSMMTFFLKSERGSSIDLIPDINSNISGASDPALNYQTNDLELGYGTAVGLPVGTSIDTTTPGRPNQAFDPFFNAIVRQIAVGLELPFEVLIKHFTASYSASQAAMLDAYRTFTTRRKWLVDYLCMPVFEAFIEEAILKGRIYAPGFFVDPIIRQAYLKSQWTGPAKAHIDPLKEVEAAEKKIDIGLSTLQDETVALTGGDWEKNHKQSVKEFNIRKKDGLITEKVYSTKNPTSNNDKEDRDEV